MRMSIIIPTYEMGGYGHTMLNQLFDDLTQQTFKDFNIIVVDQSKDDLIENVCLSYKDDLEIHYYKNSNGKNCAAENVNIGMDKANGDIIKILFMDDYLMSKRALERIVNEFNDGAKWVMTDYIHSDIDKKQFFNLKQCFYSGDLLGYHNTGTPSIHAFLREDKVEMDENLRYIVDCEFYYKLFLKTGMPNCINEVLHCLRHHPVSAAYDTKFTSLRDSEIEYCKNKYGIS